MSNPSNLYAEKVFAEHPLALWPLDDQSDYISLISEENRDYENWAISGGTAYEYLDTFDRPFVDSHISEVLGDVVSSGSGQTEIISPDIIDLSELNDYYETFTVGAYFYADNSFISAIQVGYRYYDSDSDSYILIEDTAENLASGFTPTMKVANISVEGNWLFLSETFTPPASAGAIQIVVRVNYLAGANIPENNRFFINGVSLGQWSEEFAATSLGAEPIDLPSDIALPETKCIVADAYGLQERPGYYLVSDNALMSRNAGLPMVYGASNVTTVFDNGDSPSLILPGLGFLNEVGRYKDYTVEMWLRVNPETTEYRRIFGPIASDDGLYVNGPFLTFKLGSNTISHYVGEWFRPMLLHIEVINNSFSMLVNGEQVAEASIDTASLLLPLENNEINQSQDWLGFYGHSDVYPIDIESVAIYSYQVPALVAKRRWVFGQGVEFPENINASYSGTSVMIDYPFANYSNNYSYPDIGRWDQGILDNADTDNGRLSSPSYELPNLIFNNKTQEQWLEDIEDAQDEGENFLTLFPNSEWDSTEGHIFFETFNFLINGTRAFYATFEEDLSATETQTLMYIQDKSTNNYFEAVLDPLEEEVRYIVSYGGTTETVYTTPSNPANEKFVAGLEIRRASSFFGGKLAAFFGKTSSLSLYVGGRPDFTQTFKGKIYNVGFATQRNLQSILPSFELSGIPLEYDDVFDLFLEEENVRYDAGETYFGNDASYFDNIIDGGDPPTLLPSIPVQKISEHNASYLLVLSSLFGKYALDIQTKSYWEDYVPLSYFGKFVTAEDGGKYYDLDFIQFNVDYPFFEIQEGSQYITENNLARTYISFQYIDAGANAPSSFFTKTEPAPANNVIKPGSDWINTKYEVVDGTIIYMPVGVNFQEVAIVTHIDVDAKGAINKPVSIRSLRLSSQALDASSPNQIGSRFGVPIFPFKKSGVYFNYKSENPYTIYKGSTPYLYLTRSSGVQVQGDFDENISRGLSIPINQGLSDDYQVTATQIAMRYDKDQFPAQKTELFEIQSKEQYIKFYLEPVDTSRKRAKILAINAITNSIESGISFYLNGKIVNNPVLTAKEWAMLGIGFASILNFNSFVGAIRLTGPMVFNNISQYQSTNLQEVQSTTIRSWLRVKFLGTNELDWSFWESAYTWRGVLVVSSTSYYGVDPGDIYETYTGTNKFIIDDEREFTLSQYEYSYIGDIRLRRQTIIPV